MGINEAVTKAVLAIREANKMADKAQNHEMQKLLLCATEEIINVREAALDLRQEIIELKVENDRLRQSARV
jgi:hypothetical protein